MFHTDSGNYCKKFDSPTNKCFNLINSYLQTDLQRRNEEATFKADPENERYVLEKVTGYYKYVRPDGKWQRVDYEADENGFRPIIVVGDDEPTTDETVFELLNDNQEVEDSQTESSGDTEARAFDASKKRGLWRRGNVKSKKFNEVSA